MASIFNKLRSLNASLFHHPRFRSSSSILNPTKETSRAALTLLKPEKNPQKILQIIQSSSLTPDSHLDRITFSIAISKLASLKEFDHIHSLIQDLLNRRPDLKTENFISHAIVWYGQSGMLDHAFKLFDEMSQLGVEPNVKSLNALLFACMLAKRWDEVKRVYREFPVAYGVKMNLDVYNTLIKAFCEAGWASLCYKLVDEMVRRGVKPNEGSFGRMIAGFYKEEKFEEVGKVLELMRENGVEVGIGTYNIRIQSLCKLKKSDEAKELMDGMLLSGMKANSVTYSYLIHGYCKEGKLDKAKELFEKMISSGFKPGSDCYFTLVSYLCKSGEFEEALKVCKQSMVKQWVPNFSTMKSLVVGLAQGSKVEEARELVQKMKEKFPKNAYMWDEVEQILSKSEDA